MVETEGRDQASFENALVYLRYRQAVLQRASASRLLVSILSSGISSISTLLKGLLVVECSIRCTQRSQLRTPLGEQDY